MADERIERLIGEMELEEYRNTLMSHLSTGYKQRLNLARGFINDPDVVFLDEPTLGLDVISARLLRKIVSKWAHGGSKKAVLLTTHACMRPTRSATRSASSRRGGS